MTGGPAVDVVELLQSIVKIPSVNPTSTGMSAVDENSSVGEKGLALWLESFLRRAGFAVRLDEVLPERPNLIATWGDDNGEPAVCLCSHLDVVPTTGMTIEPFGGELREGQIWGRGSADPKASVAAMIAAAIAEKDSANCPPLCLLFTTDEEAGFAGARHFVQHADTALTGAVVGEPTNLIARTSHKGIFRSRIVTRGRSAHSAFPEKGENAIMRMSDVLVALQEYSAGLAGRETHPRLGNATINVGIIEGGSAVNTVPDYCSIAIDRRTLPGETRDGILRELRSALQFDQAEVENPFLFGPGFEAPECDWVARVMKTLGQDGTISISFATDAAVLQSAGIDCVVLGPGDPAAAHTEDEHVAVDQVHRAVDQYRKIIREFAQN